MESPISNMVLVDVSWEIGLCSTNLKQNVINWKIDKEENYQITPAHLTHKLDNSMFLVLYRF